jgi:hypothetical protein
LEDTDFGILVIKLAEALQVKTKSRNKRNNKPPYKGFGKALERALKNTAKMKKVELSGSLSRGNSQLISFWCDGMQAPSADLMREVAKVLRDKLPSEEIEELRRTRWVELFLNDTQFNDMTDKERNAVAAFLRDLNV